MNDFIRERYELSMDRICSFCEEDSVKEPYRAYFCAMAKFIEKCDLVLNSHVSGEIEQWTMEQHAAINAALYEDILPEIMEEIKLLSFFGSLSPARPFFRCSRSLCD